MKKNFQKISLDSLKNPIKRMKMHSVKQSKTFSWNSPTKSSCQSIPLAPIYFHRTRGMLTNVNSLSNLFPSCSLMNPVKNISSKFSPSVRVDVSENFQLENSEIFFNLAFDKGRLKAFVLWFLKTYGQKKTVDLLEQLKELGFGYATKAGVSLGIDDLKIPPQKQNLLKTAQEKVSFSDIQYKKAQITGIERLQKFIDTWHETSENLKQEVVKYFEKTDILNPVYMMAFSGARGNLSQVRQLVGMRGLMADPQGQIIDFPIRSNFREGLTLTEYIISTYGARKGIVDTALRTANAGYLTRRLVDVAQHVIVTEFDCRTEKGIYVFEMKEANKTICTFQNRLIGRTLAKDIPISKDVLVPRNQEISEEQAEILAKVTKKALIRSPLTCQTKKFVCQLCYGWSLATNRLVSIGEAVGVIAAQSIGEPGTQLTMRTFHTGGVFSGGILEQITAMNDGIVEYPTAIAGLCVRTPQGDIAFLTKGEGSLVLRTKKISTPSIPTEREKEEEIVQVYKIPPYTLLFQRNQQKVEKKQIIAQLSAVALQKRQRGDAEQVIYSPHEGEIYHSQMDIIEKPTEYDDITFETWNSGYFWILSGKIYEFPVSSYLFVQPSDFVHQNSVLNRISWVSPQSSFVNVCLKNPQPTKISFFKFHSFFTKKNQQILLNAYYFHRSSSSRRKKLQKYSRSYSLSSQLALSPYGEKNTISQNTLPILQSHRILNVKFQNNFFTSLSFLQRRNRASLRYKDSFYDPFYSQKKSLSSSLFLQGSSFSKRFFSAAIAPKRKNLLQKFRELQKFYMVSSLFTSFRFFQKQSLAMASKKREKFRIYTRFCSKRSEGLFGNIRLRFDKNSTNQKILKRINAHLDLNSPTIQTKICNHKKGFYQKSNSKFLFYIQQKKENRLNSRFSQKSIFPSAASFTDKNKNKPSYFLLKTPLISLKLKNIRFQNTNYSFDSNISFNSSSQSAIGDFDQMFSYLSLKNPFVPFKDSVFPSSNPEKTNQGNVQIHKETLLNTYQWSPLPNLFLKWFPQSFRTISNGIVFFPTPFILSEQEKEEQPTTLQSVLSFFPYSKLSNKKNNWLSFNGTSSHGILDSPTISFGKKQIKVREIFVQNIPKKVQNTIKASCSLVYVQEIPAYRIQPNFFSFPSLTFSENEGLCFPSLLDLSYVEGDENLSLAGKGTKQVGTVKNNTKQKNKKVFTKILNFVKPLYTIKDFSFDGQKEKRDFEASPSTSPEETTLQQENLESQPEKVQRKFGVREKNFKFVRLRSRFIHYLNSSVLLKTENKFEGFSTNEKTEKLSTSFSDLFWLPKESFRLSQFKNDLDSQIFSSFQPVKNSSSLLPFSFAKQTHGGTEAKKQGGKMKFLDSQKPLFSLVNRQGIRKPVYSKIQGFKRYSKKGRFFLSKNQTTVSFSKFPMNLQNSKNQFKLFSDFQKIEMQSLSPSQKSFLDFLKNRKSSKNFKLKKTSSSFKRRASIEKKNQKGRVFNHLLLQKSSQVSASSISSIPNFQQKFPVFSKMQHLEVLDIQVEQGWIYFVENVEDILSYHEYVLPPGKECCGFTFDNQPVSLKCILPLRFSHGEEKDTLDSLSPNTGKEGTKPSLEDLLFYLKTTKPNSKLGYSVLKNPKTRFLENSLSFHRENSTSLGNQFFNFFLQKSPSSGFSFSSEKLYQTKIALFIQPLEYKLLPSLYSLKADIYKHQKKEESLSFFLLKNFHSTILNKQNPDRRILSFYPSPDFQIQSNFSLPFIETKIQNSNPSGFWNLQKSSSRNPSFAGSQNTDLQMDFQVSAPFSHQKNLVPKEISEQKMKELEEVENQRRKTNYSLILQNRKESSFNSDLKHVNDFTFSFQPYFSYFPIHFLPVTLLYKIPIDFYYPFNLPFLNFTKTSFISLDYKYLYQRSLSSLFDLVQKTSFSSMSGSLNEIQLKKSSVTNFTRFEIPDAFDSLLLVQKQKRKAKAQVKSNQLEAVSLITNSAFSPYFVLDLADKMSYLANQRLYLQETDGFFQKLKNFYQENIPSLMHFPVFRNQFVLNSTNFVPKEKTFAFTSFLSPFEGEILPPVKNSWSPLFSTLSDPFHFSKSEDPLLYGENRGKEIQKASNFSKNSLNIGAGLASSMNKNGLETDGYPSVLAFEQEDNAQKHTLVLTKANLFALSLKEKDFYPSAKDYSSIEKNQTIKEILQRQNQHFLQIDRYLNPKNIDLRKLQSLDSLPSFTNTLAGGKEPQNIAKCMQEKQEKFADQMEKTIFVKYQNKVYKIKNLSLGLMNSYKPLRVGSFLVYGDLVTPYSAVSKSGQVIHVNSNKITLRYAYPISASKRSILHVYNGDFVRRNDAIVTLPFQTLKTGDIVQGIPKVEQYFEARTSKEGRLFRDSLPNLLQGLFERYQTFLTLEKAVQQSCLKIQQIIVDGIQRVYRSQGVSISEKHLEVIVRQMTAKVQIIYAAQTGFFAGELVDLEFVEHINSFLMNKIKYEPIILGITRASLEVDSFLSAASFQQTTKILSKAAIYRKKDFLKGLKENLIVGNLIPGGTGYLVYLNDKIS